ncbi:hypothetical protein [Actinomycetospora aeridis]|uniref:DUF4267 domain-containing protein n=1 Tax=Actinomycetospora aeridis TaxID=3129231 RepID=A0ABU8NA07_9PSEU
MDESHVQRRARWALAIVRFVNGALGLLAPQFLASRVASQEPRSTAATYAFRMFGVRTVLLAIELLVVRGEGRRRALRRALVVHGSDTVSAAALALGHRVPPRTGALLTGISATNVVLALVALRPASRDDLLGIGEGGRGSLGRLGRLGGLW